jgi:hypothetical protein
MLKLSFPIVVPPYPWEVGTMIFTNKIWNCFGPLISLYIFSYLFIFLNKTSIP